MVLIKSMNYSGTYYIFAESYKKRHRSYLWRTVSGDKLSRCRQSLRCLCPESHSSRLDHWALGTDTSILRYPSRPLRWRGRRRGGSRRKNQFRRIESLVLDRDSHHCRVGRWQLGYLYPLLYLTWSDRHHFCHTRLCRFRSHTLLYQLPPG